MSHKIESTGLPTAVSALRPGRRAEDGAAAGSIEPRHRDDSLRLTDHARRATDIQAATADVPEVDSRRVSSLRQALDSGQYRVDSATVAAKLLRFEWQLAAA